ncbi:7-cyano-7-deazaguanine synthase [Methanocaldococcus infernus]
MLLKKLRVESSLKVLESLGIDEELKESLREMLKLRLETLDFYKKVSAKKKYEAVLAFSGGVDSSASAVIGRELFKIKAVFCYSPYLHKESYLDYIKELTKKLKIKLEIVEVDLDRIYKESVIENRYHPCGRCHKIIEESIYERAKDFVIFGDLLAFGSLSFYKVDNFYRINLPSFFALTKDEERKILKSENIVIEQGYGCSLLREYHIKNKSYKFTIQRILREVRAKVISPDEGFKNILHILEGEK